MANIKILDCTFRDGGYYTNWDFDKSIVDKYIDSTNNLPIDYLELGYRSNPSSSYLGKYAYCPVYEIKRLHDKSTKKLAVMLNEKDVRPLHLDYLIAPIIDCIDMVRIAIDPENFDRAIILAESLKKRGLEVGFNVMYLSKWLTESNFFSKLVNINGVVDVFCMVDSYGGIMPNDLRKIVSKVKNSTTVPIGFHGHNNLELALISAITAIECGVEFIDTTILGMGRGAGNLKTELILTYLNRYFGLDVDFNALGNAIQAFLPLLNQYQWGTNLPYMISGVNSFPQKDVMDMASNRMYSFNNIVRVLENKRANVEDNQKYPEFKKNESENVLIVGGGINAKMHIEGIQEFVKYKQNLTIIHASTKNASAYKEIDVPQIFCLVGNEGSRLETVFDSFVPFVGTCILPPFPRKMGTEIPQLAQNRTFELSKIKFTDLHQDSCTTLALQTALDLNAKNIYIVGYDGYPEGLMTSKEKDLSEENIYIFSKFNSYCENKILSLTPTIYDLQIESVYQNL